MTYKYTDFGIRVTNNGQFEVFKRSDGSTVESHDLTQRNVKFPGDDTHVGPITESGEHPSEVWSSTDLSGNNINLQTDGKLCKNQGSGCRSIVGETVIMRLIENGTEVEVGAYNVA
jgi:hypothetical protein